MQFTPALACALSCHCLASPADDFWWQLTQSLPTSRPQLLLSSVTLAASTAVAASSIGSARIHARVKPAMGCERLMTFSSVAQCPRRRGVLVGYRRGAPASRAERRDGRIIGTANARKG